MLAQLALGETSVGELAEPYKMSLAGASKHVKVLEAAGLVARRKHGRTHLCSLEAKPLEEAERWLKQWEKFWNVRLDRLEARSNAIRRRRMTEASADIRVPVQRSRPTRSGSSGRSMPRSKRYGAI